MEIMKRKENERQNEEAGNKQGKTSPCGKARFET